MRPRPLRPPTVGPLGVLVVSAVLLACSPGGAGDPAAPDPSARRELPSGSFTGSAAAHGSHAWLGIPFARPPVGELRWRAPQPAEPAAGERQALALASPCSQFASAFGDSDAAPGTPIGSEDCLYLNVWAPRFAPEQVPEGEARLPVMVWIHGGGNTIGHGGFYDGAHLATRHDLIVLTVNYRLGALGWFRHPALVAESRTPEDASGNYGTLDLIRALAWVRDNISAFGGDPDNVTIFGESAGGRNVMSLVLSPLAQGLFHRAIVQSGRLATTGLATASGFTDDPRPGHASSPQEVSLRLLVADGSAADRDAAREHLRGLSSNQVASWLRALSDRELLSAYRGELGMYDLPQIVRDGHVIPGGEPIAHLARRSYNRVPIILGSNRDENKLFMFASPEYVQRLFGIPLWLRDEARYNLLAEYQSKAWKISGVDRPAIVLADVQPGKVFAYRWDWDEEPNLLLADLSVMLGAAHALEIPFVFGHWELGRAGNVIFSEENEAGRLELSQAMMSYWAEFAYTGAPGRGRAGELPLWAAWENRNPTAKFMVLDTTAGGGLRMDGEALAKPYLITLIDSDPRLPTQRDKCEVFFELVRGSGELSEAEYPRVGTKGCKDYPLEEYPWDG